MPCHLQAQLGTDSNESKLGRHESIKFVRTKGIRAFSETFLARAVSPETAQHRPELVKHLVSMIEKNNTESGIVAALFALVSRTDTTDSLKTISIPALILVGDSDKVTPPPLAEQLHAEIRGSRLALVPMSGHMSPIENPDAFNASLLGFLRDLPAATQ
jgi:3-oxoadipate enol-lactonase